MKKYKQFINENDNIKLIEDIIPKEKIYFIFEKYSLSCDPKQNINDVEYIYDYYIKCSFTSYTYDGKVPTNILETLSKISKELDADDFTFRNYSRFGSYLVTFEYTEETLNRLEMEINANKFNL